MPAKPAARKSVAAKPAVKVAYPKPAEKLQPPHYTIQIVAGAAAQRVEVRINDQPWTPCREALGLYWFDWTGLQTGKHTIAARAQHSDGKVVETPKRTVVVL
jgi:hypothetical protein